MEQMPSEVEKIEIDHDNYRGICAFCAEVNGVAAHNAFARLMPDVDPANCVLYETRRFVVIPCVGAACDGYVLIVPKEHVLSIGHLNCGHDAELAALVNRVFGYLSEQYGLPVVAFEHGAESFRNRGGACTDHAHVHFLPASSGIDLVSLTRADFQLRRVTDLSIAARCQVSERQRPYLWIREQDEAMWICDAPDALSQYLRRILLAQLGRGDEWDWATFPGVEFIRSTIQRFRDAPMR